MKVPGRGMNAWKHQIQKRFGLTPACYQKLLQGQDGRCAICRKTPEENGQRLAVDHCHHTERIRGLLCKDCNLGIGRLGDTVAAVERALNYLKGDLQSPSL